MADGRWEEYKTILFPFNSSILLSSLSFLSETCCECEIRSPPSTKTPINLYQKERRSQPSIHPTDRSTMVYESLPAYLDPSNWNQKKRLQTDESNTGGVTGGVPARTEGGSSTAGSAVRSESVADRARLARLPQPDTALKCPRCDSTNTKFCYFNNYSLSQPRHFCKACRRYWTRGGALRNVPVGGGCRRNKRIKRGSSKSSVPITQSTAIVTSGSSGAAASTGMDTPQFPFMTSLLPLSEYGITNIGMNYGGIQTTVDPVVEQWKINQQLQQFPFGGDQTAPTGLMYPFDTEMTTTPFGDQTLGKSAASRLISQIASVKREENRQAGMNLSRQYQENNNIHSYWGSNSIGGGGDGSSTATAAACWTDNLSGFNSTPPGNLL